MVNYSYQPIENQHDNMPNWYRPNIDPKVLKELMKRKDLHWFNKTIKRPILLYS